MATISVIRLKAYLLGGRLIDTPGRIPQFAKDRLRFQDNRLSAKLHSRIPALTGGPVPRKTYWCDHQHGDCATRHLFLGLTTELKRSKTIISRLSKVLFLLDAIHHVAVETSHAIQAKKITAISFESIGLIPEQIQELRRMFHKPIPTEPLDNDENLTPAERLSQYLLLRTTLSASKVAAELSLLNIMEDTAKRIQADVQALPSFPKEPGSYPFIPTNTEWKRILKDHHPKIYEGFTEAKSPLGDLTFHLRKTYDLLVDQTREKLLTAFSIATLNDMESLDEVIAKAIVELPQNDPKPKNTAIAWLSEQVIIGEGIPT